MTTFLIMTKSSGICGKGSVIINIILQTNVATSQWPSQKYAVKVAEKLGHTYEGQNVTYEDYLLAYVESLQSKNSDGLDRMNEFIRSLSERFIKVIAAAAIFAFFRYCEYFYE